MASAKPTATPVPSVASATQSRSNFGGINVPVSAGDPPRKASLSAAPPKAGSLMPREMPSPFPDTNRRSMPQSAPLNIPLPQGGSVNTPLPQDGSASMSLQQNGSLNAPLSHGGPMNMSLPQSGSSLNMPVPHGGSMNLSASQNGSMARGGSPKMPGSSPSRPRQSSPGAMSSAMSSWSQRTRSTRSPQPFNPRSVAESQNASMPGSPGSLECNPFGSVFEQSSQPDDPLANSLPSRLTSGTKDGTSDVASVTDLRTELKELRSSLERKHAHHQQVGAKARGSSVGNSSVASHESKHMPSSNKQQVQPVEQEVHKHLEHEVRELCASVGKQQMEQANFLKMLMGEINMLKDQVQASRAADHLDSEFMKVETARQIDELRTALAGQQQWKSLQEKTAQSVHSELDTLTSDVAVLKQQLKSSMEEVEEVLNFSSELATMKMQLKAVNDLSMSRKNDLDVDFKKFKADMHAEFQKMQASSVPREENGGNLANDVASLVECIDEWKAHHNATVEALETEVKNVRNDMQAKEVQSASATDKGILELRISFQEHQKQALAALHKIQADMERKMQMQAEEYVQSLKRNNDLTMQMQADMKYLLERGMGQGSAQQGDDLQQESLQQLRDLQAKVELLQQKHEDTHLIHKDHATALQANADIREEFLSATQAQKSDVAALMQQIKEQKAEIGMITSVSKAAADMREAEVVSMRRAFEQHMQQHAEAMNSLKSQISGLNEELPAWRARRASTGDISGAQTSQDVDITRIKCELDQLKLQSTLQRSLTSTEVAKEAAAMHGQLHKVVGTEREARIQDTNEMRELIKSLFQELSRSNQHGNAHPDDIASTTSTSSTRASGGYPSEL